MQFLILFALLAGAFASAEDCPANAHYKECGTACPLTCKNHNDPPKACVLMCVSGCFCDEGFVKTEDGRCVDPERCSIEEKNCADKPDKGVCRGYFTMWYYDADALDCKQFIYGGCQGNGNRYPTKMDCMRKCADRSIWDIKSDKCFDPVEAGLCKGYFPRYYFDKNTGECRQFVYGGCGGNKNNYKTKEDCEKSCKKQDALQNFSREICNLEMKVGLCRGAFPRFFFNRKTGQCEEFIYGGCGGNENNFESQQECENRCLV